MGLWLGWAEKGPKECWNLDLTAQRLGLSRSQDGDCETVGFIESTSPCFFAWCPRGKMFASKDAIEDAATKPSKRFAPNQAAPPVIPQPIHQPLPEPVQQPIHQPVEEAINQPVEEPIQQPIQETIHQPPVHQPTNFQEVSPHSPHSPPAAPPVPPPAPPEESPNSSPPRSRWG